MISPLCRLKVLPTIPIPNIHKTSCLSLIKPNTVVEEASFLPNETVALDKEKINASTGLYRRDRKDISRHKPSRGSSLIINEDRDDAIKDIGMETFLRSKRSPIPLKFTLATIYRTWKFSRESCPSIGYNGSSMRKLSTSATKFSSFMNSGTFKKFTMSGKSKKTDFWRTTFNCERFSNDSSSKEPCSNKVAKSETCQDQAESAKLEVSKDNISPSKCDTNTETSLKDCTKESPISSKTCPTIDTCSSPRFEPTCLPVASCPNVEDYCRPEKSYPERFWRILVLFFAFPTVAIMSVLVYEKEREERKKPRPPFVDVPYMRHIVKPFPWGDGRRTLFHNPVKNPISPDGYLVEDPNALPTHERRD